MNYQQVIEYTFHGPPVPYVRMNHQNRWSDRVKNYLDYKRAFAEALEATFLELVDKGPSTRIKKERLAWLKQHRSDRYALYYTVYEASEKADWDNYGKAISDAIQDAGLVSNDKKIKTGQWAIEVDAENPRVEFRLEKIA